MANVPLRTYINEIESIIEQSQTEEAIAHCRHILQAYPKNIDTYRMLGKAYLESQRYSNAADIFQRVLSAIPDDFVSHVGMSIIREDESDLDAAIWHMERAFEGQPYNSAIQGELRRLFGLRDGMEPPKVHLTRGALARMYVKGDLHQQAIAELRSAIAEDPQRFDLQVSLAQMYAQSGQNPKAIDTCGTIINKLPYCLEANLILSQLLGTTDRSEEVNIYKQRVQELNPYYAYTGPNAPTEDRVPAQAVLVEQLVWDGGPAVAASDQPEWASSVGVTLGDSRSVEDELPDWMADPSDEGSALPSGGAEAEDDIPDFMKEAGWAPSTGAFDESKSAFDLDDDEAALEPAEAVAGDMPDWLQQMAPPDALENTDESAEALDAVLPPEDDTPPDWLQAADSETESEEGGLPDWLAPAAAAGVAGAIALSSPDDEISEAEETSAEADLPDWLQEAINEEDDSPSSTDETKDISDGLAPAAGAAVAASLLSTDEEKAEPVDGEESSGVTDWLQELTIEEEAVQEATPEVEAVEGELPDWLQESAVAEDEDEPVTDLEPSADEAEDLEDAEETEIPDWLQESMEEEEGEPVADLETSTDETAPEPTVEMDSVEIEEEDDIPDWLAPAAGAAVAGSLLSTDDEKVTPVDGEESSGVTDWLQELTIEDEALQAAAPEVETVEDELPDWLQESVVAEDEVEPVTDLDPSADEAVDLEDAEETELPDWLQESVEEEEAAQEAVPEVEAMEGELPDWLQESEAEDEIEPVADLEPSVDEAAPEPTVEMDSVEVEEEDGIPDWLAPAAGAAVAGSLLSTDDEKAEPVDGEESSGVTDWLQELTIEEEAVQEATPEVESVEDEIEPVADLEPSADETVDLQDAEETELPDWLQESMEEDPTPVAEIGPVETADARLEDSSEAVEIPDWLQETDSEEDVISETTAEEDSSEPEIPDWLQESADEDDIAPIAESELIDELTPESVSEIEEIVGAEAELPDGFEESAEEQSEPAGLADENLEAGLETETDEIPDWLQEAVDDEALETEAEVDPVEAEETEIPDWLQSAMGEDESESSVAAETLETELPEWIQEVTDEESVDEPAETDDNKLADTLKTAGAMEVVATGIAAISDRDDVDSVESEAIEADSPVETLAAEEVDIAEAESIQTQAEDETDEITTDDLPDWLQEIPEETYTPTSEAEETTTEEEIIPDWLQDISDEVPAIAGESEIEAEKQIEPESEDIPEWLHDIAEEQTSDITEEPESIETPDFEDADAAMAWMESLAAKQGVSEDELLSTPEERSETPPDWVQEIVSSDEDATPEIETIAAEEPLDEVEPEAVPDWLAETIQTEETEQTEVETDESITETQGDQEPVLESLEILQEPLPSETVEPEIEAVATPENIVEIEEQVEIEDPAREEDIVAPDFEDADAAMAWLENLAAKQGVSEDELLTRPEERSETPPDWVQDTVQTEPSQSFEEITISAEEPISEDIDLPDLILETPETEESVLESEPITGAIDADENELAQAVAPVAPVAEELPSDDIDLPDWILEAPETEEAFAEPDAPSLVEAPEIAEVASADIDTALEAEDTVPDFDDADAAMAWLESLAAKQGVSEDELLTTPEARSETPPDWVQDTIEAEAPPESEEILAPDDTAGEAEDLSDWLAKVPDAPETEEGTTEPEVEQPVSESGETSGDASESELDFDDADAAMAWLESLAVKQGVSEEELLTRPEERSETPPDWVQSIEADEEVAETEPQAEPEPQETEAIEISRAQFLPEDDALPPIMGEEASIAPPSWISDGDVPEDEDFSWLQSAVSEEEDKLLDLNLASLIQLERLPGVGFRRAQSITAYRDEHGAFTSFDDLRYVPGMDSDTLALLKARAFIETPDSEPVADLVEEAALFETQETDDAVPEQQLAAQSKLNQGEISEAMADYGDLIKKGQRLDEIIEDLKFAAEKFPKEMAIVQTLGDAYMQANQLEEALEAYTKAEGLLK